MNKRRYTKRRRAEQEAETRRRIVAAAAELHGEKGPRDTTVSAIAARAGVQRLTVYRHFPDERSLFQACTSHWLADNPPPGLDDWAGVQEPEHRTRTALTALYAYYRRTSEMWRLSYRDREDVEALQAPMAGFQQHLDRIRQDLLSAWKPGRGTGEHMRAVLGHCLRYGYWRDFNEEGLADEAMAALATAWLRCIAAGRPEKQAGAGGPQG
ncbi:MAG TPA: TetR/AcrR family transcriptional regulator [Arenicellales bacterium]|nr:TetR/AcrR family transcriptional regulator [Arenicellales bacterium]